MAITRRRFLALGGFPILGCASQAPMLGRGEYGSGPPPKTLWARKVHCDDAAGGGSNNYFVTVQGRLRSNDLLRPVAGNNTDIAVCAAHNWVYKDVLIFTP